MVFIAAFYEYETCFNRNNAIEENHPVIKEYWEGINLVRVIDAKGIYLSE